MFAKTIIDSDAFLDMPNSTQALYFHLGMRADDEGFINNAKKIQRIVSASDDDLKLLIAKRFVIPFQTGIIVIKHWKLHNCIRQDRIKETMYQKEKALLSEKENGVYSECPTNDRQMTGNSQHRLGKGSIGKVNIETPCQTTSKFNEQSIEYGLSNLLYTKMLENDAKTKQPNLYKWAEHIDKLMRIDGRSQEEIEAVIVFATKDEFWQSNILSTSKLRQKFPQLILKINKTSRGEKVAETKPGKYAHLVNRWEPDPGTDWNDPTIF